MLGRLARGVGDFARLKHNFRWLRGEALERYQRERLRSLVAHSVARSPFYCNLYAGRDLDDFESLPTIDKSTAMEHFDALNTVGLTKSELFDFALEQERAADHLGYYRERWVVGMSSGTTGGRGLVLTDRRLSERLPFVFAARSGIPLRLLPWRIAFLLRVFSQAFQDINGPLVSLRYVPTHLPPRELAARVNEVRANVITGPPSALRLLAQEARALSTLPKLLVSYAEVLYEDDRTGLERDLGAPVIELCHASEGPIASACQHGTLHINEDLVYVELFGEDGRSVTAPGTEAHRMLVTNLFNLAQPLIRYEMGDVIALGEPCSCGSGFRTVERIVGRSDDVMWFRDGRGDWRHVFPDLASRWIISASDAVLDYRVFQASPDTLEIAVEVADDTDEEAVFALVEEAFVRNLAGLGCQVATVKVGRLALEPDRRSKRRRFARGFEAPR